MTDLSLDLKNYILKNNKAELKIKPNSNVNKMTKFENNIFYIDICEVPKENKANIELIKFIKKLTSLNVEIKVGKNSKNKVVKLI